MKQLDFYTVDLEYVKHLQKGEKNTRGFSRVPNIDYGYDKKRKFLCGVVLQINGIKYYVPVTSYKQQMRDNFLVYSRSGKVVSSLRFNYMFPVPDGLIERRVINDEPDIAYRTLLAQELQYCIKNQNEILRLAKRTYKRVIMGKDPGLTYNSCNFALLEQLCHDYTKAKGQKMHRDRER